MSFRWVERPEGHDEAKINKIKQMPRVMSDIIQSPNVFSLESQIEGDLILVPECFQRHILLIFPLHLASLGPCVVYSSSDSPELGDFIPQ